MHGGHSAHRNIPVLNYRFSNRRRKNQAAAIKFHTRFGDFNQPVESAATNLPKPSNFPSETIFRGQKIPIISPRFDAQSSPSDAGHRHVHGL